MTELKTTIIKTVVGIEQEEPLPEGQYRCPSCDGTGQYYLYKHGCPGITANNKKKYTTCLLCNGEGIVQKCMKCGKIVHVNNKKCVDCMYEDIITKKR